MTFYETKKSILTEAVGGGQYLFLRWHNYSYWPM